MQVHLFRGSGRIFGFTPDDSGANLPPACGPWTTFKTVEMTRDAPMPGVDVRDCLDDIDRFGVHVTDAHVRITDSVV